MPQQVMGKLPTLQHKAWAISLLPTLTLKLVIASKKINTIRMYNNCSLEASQNKIVLLAKRRWEIFKPPCLWDLAWKPQRKPPSSVHFNNLLNTSLTKRNNNGGKGSPWRIPRELPKKPAGDPFTRTENLTVEIQVQIHLPHLAPKPILSIR